MTSIDTNQSNTASANTPTTVTTPLLQRENRYHRYLGFDPRVDNIATCYLAVLLICLLLLICIIAWFMFDNMFLGKQIWMFRNYTLYYVDN